MRPFTPKGEGPGWSGGGDGKVLDSVEFSPAILGTEVLGIGAYLIVIYKSKSHLQRTDYSRVAFQYIKMI